MRIPSASVAWCQLRGDVRSGSACLLAALEKQRVAFVVVGSVAAMAHGAPAEPADLDVVPATDPENLERLSRALAELDARPIAEAGHWERDPFGEWCWISDPEPRPIAPLDPGDSATFDPSFETCCGRLDVVPEVAGPYGELKRRVRIGPWWTILEPPSRAGWHGARDHRLTENGRGRHRSGLHWSSPEQRPMGVYQWHPSPTWPTSS